MKSLASVSMLLLLLTQDGWGDTFAGSPSPGDPPTSDVVEQTPQAHAANSRARGETGYWNEARSFHPPKSHGVAYLWALGATLLPIAASTMASDDETVAWIIAGSLVLGPSAGQYYAGSYAKGVAATGFRLAAVPLGLIVGGIASSASSKDDSNGEGFSDTFDALNALAAAMIAGSIVVAAGTVYSLVDTKFAVDRANEQARKEFRSRMSLSPTLYPTRDGRFAPGLAARVSF